MNQKEQVIVEVAMWISLVVACLGILKIITWIL
mgnify:CR=1 FL=1|jgi:hypothetical protein